MVSNRWVQLTAGVVGMVAVANYQYGWTLFVTPMQTRHGWNREAIQAAMFLFFIPAQTWLVPLEGYLADRFGPRWLLVGGGVLAAVAWGLLAVAQSLPVVYAAMVLCGCASGIVYGISMGGALKWFPDRRGLAAGLTAAAFGAGSAATVLPIDWTIRVHGYETAFWWFGIGQGLVIVLAGLVVRFPNPGEGIASLAPQNAPTGRDATPQAMLRTPAFWLLYGMMTVGAIPGLLMMGQMSQLAEDFGIARQPVTLLGVTLAALPFALMLDRILGGLTRPVFGWVSDRIGREWAMFLAFGLEGGALTLLIVFADNPVLFVLTSGVAFFGWGAVFSLFPAATGDLFGRRFATTNYALLYTAKGTASLVILLGNRIQEATSRWDLVFAFMIAADWAAALLALFVLRPLRRRMAEHARPPAAAPGAPVAVGQDQPSGGRANSEPTAPQTA